MNRLPPPHCRCLALLLLLASATGCGVLGKHKAKSIPQPGVVDPTQPRELQMVSLPSYVVEPPDELEISARPAGLAFPTSTAVVRHDGVIDLGFYGDIYVAGLTLEEVELKIAQMLEPDAAAKKLSQPVIVSARLISGSQSKQYYVMGAVTQQGKFPITGSETVLDAILQAGLRSNSMPEKAYLVRPHPCGAGNTILKIDWDAIRDCGDTLTNYQIFPGDRIIVPGGKPPGLLSSLIGG